MTDLPVLVLKEKRWYGALVEYLVAKLTAMDWWMEVEVNCLKVRIVPMSFLERAGS